MYFSAPQCHFYSCGLGRREKEKEEETKLGLERGVRRKGGGGGGCAPPPLKQSSREGPSLDSPKGLCCPLQSKSFTRRKEEEPFSSEKGRRTRQATQFPPEEDEKAEEKTDFRQNKKCRTVQVNVKCLQIKLVNSCPQGSSLERECPSLPHPFRFFPLPPPAFYPLQKDGFGGRSVGASEAGRKLIEAPGDRRRGRGKWGGGGGTVVKTERCDL